MADRTSLAWTVVRYLVLAVGGLLLMTPFLYMVGTSFIFREPRVLRRSG